jgi:uncharacterized protein YndB with AHSA1/START domain
MSPRETGHTQDAGWQIGVSKTVDHPLEIVWEFLTSAAGTELWLGHGVTVLDERGHEYRTDDGTVGETRTFRREDRIRLTWQPADWDHDSTLQVTVSPSGHQKTTIRFHQDRLLDAREREQQRDHWRAVMRSVVAALDALEY